MLNFLTIHFTLQRPLKYWSGEVTKLQSAKKYKSNELGTSKTSLWRPCNLTSFSPCLTGPVDYPFASRQKGPGFKPLGGLMWNRDSPVSIVSLLWWPRRDWSFVWPRLRWASSRTITRPSYRQCDNPTWSHTVLSFRFHARCRSPLRCLDGTSTNWTSTEHFYPHGTSTKRNVHLDISSFGQLDPKTNIYFGFSVILMFFTLELFPLLE